MNLPLFYVWEDARNGIIGIIPLIRTSVIWGQYPVFLPPEFPSGCTVGGQLQ